MKPKLILAFKWLNLFQTKPAPLATNDWASDYCVSQRQKPWLNTGRAAVSEVTKFCHMDGSICLLTLREGTEYEC